MIIIAFAAYILNYLRRFWALTVPDNPAACLHWTSKVMLSERPAPMGVGGGELIQIYEMFASIMTNYCWTGTYRRHPGRQEPARALRYRICRLLSYLRRVSGAEGPDTRRSSRAGPQTRYRSAQAQGRGYRYFKSMNIMMCKCNSQYNLRI